MRRLSALLAITIASAFAPSQSALSQQQQGTRSARMGPRDHTSWVVVPR
jgi:invasion protein IalB